MSAGAGTSPSRGRWFVIVAALFAGALTGFWLLSDALDQVQRGEAAAGWLDETIDVRRNYLANPEAYAQDVAVARKDLAMLEQRLPAQFADAEVDAGLRSLAERHGLALERIERGSESPRELYASRELRFVLLGTAPALQAFFRDYADIVPIQRVSRLRITPVAGSDAAFSAAVQADEYRYLEDETRR